MNILSCNHFTMFGLPFYCRFFRTVYLSVVCLCLVRFVSFPYFALYLHFPCLLISCTMHNAHVYDAFSFPLPSTTQWFNTLYIYFSTCFLASSLICIHTFCISSDNLLQFYSFSMSLFSFSYFFFHVWFVYMHAFEMMVESWWVQKHTYPIYHSPARLHS